MNSWPPAHLSPTTNRSQGPRAATFIEQFCRITKQSVGGNAGDLIVLRPWQKRLLNGLLSTENGRLIHRQALIGMPRKNGKSALGAGLALWSLLFGVPGGEVYSVAGDREQARLVFGTAKRIIELDPELQKLITVYRDAMEVPGTGSVYRVRSAEAGLSEGLSPTFVVFDEVHVQPCRELWDAMDLGRGARDESLLLGITTAGVRTDRYGGDSLAYGLYQYGTKVASGEIDDPTFYFAWWEPHDKAADWMNPETWRNANPGFDDLVGGADFHSTIKRTPEAVFRTKRCNQWVATVNTWLPTGAWDKCKTDRKLVPGQADVVLAFDGSVNNDSTALLVCSIEDNPHVEVVGLWEKPIDNDSWKVPIEEVEDAIRDACDLWHPREIAADIYHWGRSLSILADEGLPVVEFPQQDTLMIPACESFYEAVLAKRVSHNGDPRLARHVTNAAAQNKARGSRIVKEGGRNSGRKIDLAVCAVMAHHRASLLSGKPAGGPQVHDLSQIVKERGPERIAALITAEADRRAAVLRNARAR